MEGEVRATTTQLGGTVFSIRGSLAAIAMLIATPLATHAQSESAFAGWVGLVMTPVGAFTPVVTGRPAAGNRSTGLQVRTSRWQFAEDDDNTLNIGVGGVLNRGRTRSVLEVGMIKQADCSECDVFMAGVDLTVDLAQKSSGSTTWLVGLNPAFGYANPKEGSGNALTGALSLPLSASINTGSSVRFVPFVSPGYGFSRISGEGESSTGSRGMVAGGVSIGGQKSPWLATISARKIFLDETPTIFGVGLAFAR